MNSWDKKLGNYFASGTVRLYKKLSSPTMSMAESTALFLPAGWVWLCTVKGCQLGQVSPDTPGTPEQGTHRWSKTTLPQARFLPKATSE